MQYVGAVETSWPAYIAQERGIFKQNHLNVNFVKTTDAPTATAALINGSYDVANIDLFNTAPLITQGQDFQVIVEVQPISDILLAGKGVKTGSLSTILPLPKGTTVGAPSTGGAIAHEIEYMNAKYGGSASELKIVADKSGAALLAGAVKYEVADPGVACVLQQQGASEVFDDAQPAGGTSAYPKLTDFLGLPDNGYWATAAWVKDNRTQVREIQDSITAAIAWMKANPQQTAALLRKSEDFNEPSLSGSQWNTCVAHIVRDFSPGFPMADGSRWSTLLKATGIITSPLPTYANWQAPGLPRD